jgi:divalent metal cation (Fe/Co/Zn/Cd) transporter
MAMPSLAELLDASLPKKINEEIIDISMSVDGVRDVHDLKTRRSGMSMIINAHVVVSPNISVVEAHEIATNVESAITEKFGHETQISIHIEPDLQSL